MQKATFAAGCFWGVESYFKKIEGVLKTQVGYTGGQTDNPSYENVCAGNTGHAEAVEIDYNSKIISFKELLRHFWQSHDPTTVNQQGPDVGSQYRSAVFYHTEEQKIIAFEVKDIMSSQFEKPIVTEISPAVPFYRAEEYHQCYLEKKKG